MKKCVYIDPNWPILISDLGNALNVARQTVNTWATRGLNENVLPVYGEKLKYTTVREAKEFFKNTDYYRTFDSVLNDILCGKYSIRNKWYPLSEYCNLSGTYIYSPKQK